MSMATQQGGTSTILNGSLWLYAGFAALSAFAGAVAAMVEGGAPAWPGVLAAIVAAVVGVGAWRHSLALIAQSEGVASAPARGVRATEAATVAS